MTVPLLIDCDPGIDHVATLFYAARHFDLVQVTTVHGNAPLTTTTRNALRLLAFGGLAVPVAAGSASPLVEPNHSAELFHGEDGLGGIDLPDAQYGPEPRHAVEAIIETARTHRGRLVMACLGPLTNLALALRREPLLAEWIETVAIMGGSHGIGQMTPTAEFNFWCDPEAAAIVCESALRTRIIGYEVTRTIGFSAADMARMAGSGQRIAGLVAAIFSFNLERQRAVWGLEHAPIHSTLTLVPFLRPDLFRTRHISMAVELSGKYTRAMTVYDTRTLRMSDQAPFEYLPPNEVELVTSAHPSAISHVIETLLTYD